MFGSLGEQAFRYDNRKGLNDGERFDIAVRRIFGKRLTRDRLTGKWKAREGGYEPGAAAGQREGDAQNKLFFEGRATWPNLPYTLLSVYASSDEHYVTVYA
jgi:hypothetical protein